MDWNQLLAKSAEFEDTMYEYYSLDMPDKSLKARLAKIMCSISFEHSQSLKMLLASGNFTSAVCLLRLQYESYVKAVWVYYAAKESEITKLAAVLDYSSEKRANKLPMLSKMIEALELTAPIEAVAPIKQFKEYSWKSLSSYVHGGLHAIERHTRGYPENLLVQNLKISNGVNGLIGMFSAVLSGEQSNVRSLDIVYRDFKDCVQYLELPAVVIK